MASRRLPEVPVLSIRQIPVLLRFHTCALWDQMLRIRCLKDPSAVTDSCAGVLVNSQHMCHTEIRIISFHSGRLVHTDKAASLVYPLCKCSNKLLILPGIPAAPGASGSTCIDYDIYILQYTIFTSSKEINFTSTGSPDKASLMWIRSCI